MSELSENISFKVNKVKEFLNKLNELLEKIEELEDGKKKDLPKFNGPFDEESLSKYFEELEKSIKNPIRYRRKSALKSIGISGLEKVTDEIFDDDTIEETIELLQKLKDYERLFRILSSKIISLIVQSNINNLNSKLKNVFEDINFLKKIEEIKSEEVVEFYLQKYLDEEYSISNIDEIIEKVIMIEKTFNLQIRKDEIDLTADVYKLLKDVETYGGKSQDNQQLLNLNDVKEKLISYKNSLEEKYKQIRREIDFWQKLFSGEYIPETKNIEDLNKNLKKLKEKIREKFNSFKILEQIHNLKLDEGINNLEEIASRLEKIVSYFTNIEIKDKEDIKIIEKLYESIEWLEKIDYPNINQVCKDSGNTEKFLKEINQIEEEYRRLKEDLKVYSKILEDVGDQKIEAYQLLKQKINEYKEKLQDKIGKEFESIIKFLKGEINNIDVDKETIVNFVKIVKPFLKEALEI